MPYDEARAAHYDELHTRRFEEAPQAVSVLAQLHAEAGAGPVLELGVGTGRLALPLAAQGIEVWGVDSSEPMLARLQAKPGGEAVRAIRGDFGDLSGAVGDTKFSLVFVVFNTLFELATQEAQIRCVQEVAEHLAPGGVFVIEALAPDLTRLEQTVHALSAGGGEVVIQATRHDPVTQQVSGADITVFDGAVQVSPWSIRYASVPELDVMARLAGLRLRHRWGSWHREPFTGASSTHVSTYGPG